MRKTVMKTRRLLIASLLAACAGASASAQVKSKPDLSGVWLVDQSKSEKTNSPLEDSEISVTIQQNEPEIKMVRRYQMTSLVINYFTDGREISTKKLIASDVLKATTKWDGDKLVNRTLTRRIVMGRSVDMDVVEEWKLSKDGKTLTKKIIIIFPRNAPDKVNAVPVARPTEEFKKVYNRQAS